MRRSRRGRRAGRRHIRVPQELERSSRLPSATRWRGVATPQSSGRRAGVGPRRANTGARAGTAKRRITKRGGRDGGTSERFIVLWTQGNSPHGDPAEGRGRWVMEPLEGNMAGASDPDPVFTK